MMQAYLDSGSLSLELYVEFSRLDEGLATSTSLLVRKARTIENVDSPTTLLESSHYDTIELSMEIHSFVSTLDFNHGRQNTEPLGFGEMTVGTRKKTRLCGSALVKRADVDAIYRYLTGIFTGLRPKTSGNNKSKRDDDDEACPEI
ncbi:hypothetical protein J1N35_002654 [Gossypium stocksii]|uniref:Uncharacterized protein n=1 Tax=Gossypium stocksii TaxID=47602 RepID=A0A9D3WM65_9ROSI|nr:hypothetical protein J1N35_002654 [Gossypium stocksii]